MKHLARALAIRRTDNRGVEVEESTLLEKPMHCESGRRTNTQYGAHGARAGTQVKYLAEEL
jgi:hypothetical protein